MKTKKKKYDQAEIVKQCIEAFKLGRNPTTIPEEFLNAFKQGHKKNVRKYVDDDLAYNLLRRWLLNRDQEAKKALLYLRNYYDETLNGFIKKGDKSAVNAKFYKEIVNERNARRRDLLVANEQSVVTSDATNLRKDYVDESVDNKIREEFLNQNRNLFNHEDVLIALIDEKYSGNSDE